MPRRAGFQACISAASRAAMAREAALIQACTGWVHQALFLFCCARNPFSSLFTASEGFSVYSRLKLVPATVLLLLSGALACNVHSQCATQTACCSGFGGKGVIAASHCTSSGDEVQCEAVVKVSRYPAQTGPWRHVCSHGTV